jgi:hypothetical protein
VGKGGEVRIITPETGRSVPLKVGQSIDMSSGRVEESYRRPPPAPAPVKETPPVTTTPGAAQWSAPPSRQDDTPADVQGDILPPR